jgi:hypothetical protein
LEILEIAGRPAVLQEWLIGLPSMDWPLLMAGAPGVWLRLITQAALGIQAAHAAGLVHGHLAAEHFLLQNDGLVKLCGLGEPPWLAAVPGAAAWDEPARDLQALGCISAGWCEASSKRKKGKGLPDTLQAVLDRLVSEAPAKRYATAGALLEDLDRAGADVPANAEAWDRLLRHVRDHAVAEGRLKESA